MKQVIKLFIVDHAGGKDFKMFLVLTAMGQVNTKNIFYNKLDFLEIQVMKFEYFSLDFLKLLCNTGKLQILKTKFFMQTALQNKALTIITTWIENLLHKCSV